jgi:hypothetical protein
MTSKKVSPRKYIVGVTTKEEQNYLCAPVILIFTTRTFKRNKQPTGNGGNSIHSPQKTGEITNNVEEVQASKTVSATL